MRTLEHSGSISRSNPSDRSKVNVMLELMGYSALYPPQELALSKGITDGKNLLIATPTASDDGSDRGR